MAANQPKDRTHIIRAATRGAEGAFDELVRLYAARLRWLVKLRIDPAMRARISADDVLQEALMVASRRIREFVVRDEPAFWAWLCRVVEHRLIDFHRRHLQSEKRDARRELHLASESSEADRPIDEELPALDQSSPSERLRSLEQREVLERALDRLIPAQRDVIVLRVLEGQSTQETALLLGRSPGAVSVLLNKAMKRLALALESTGIEREIR